MALSSPNNLTRLTDAGWTIPSNLYLEHPSSATIKSSLVAPFQNDGGGICSKRAWLAHTLAPGNYDPVQINITNGTANSMHRRAVRAWFEKDINGSNANFATYMTEAKTAFNTQCDAKIASNTAFTSFIVASIGARDEIAAILALDWILWDDAAEYEAAFDKVRLLVEKKILAEEIGGRTFHTVAALAPSGLAEGYLHASSGEGAHYLEPLLALVAHNVNPTGASTTYTSDLIDRFDISPENENAVYSPFHCHNIANLLSVGNGGGREWGTSTIGTSMGGYELNIQWPYLMLIPVVDTATNNAFNLVRDNYYLQTRQVGLTVQEDLNVEKSGMNSGPAGVCQVLARLLGDTPEGRRYSWITERSANHAWDHNLRIIQAVAGPKPTAEGPTGTFADRVGSRWWYIEDLSNIDSSYRMFRHHRNLESHREIGDARVGRTAIGNVGLVEGHANRGAPNGCVTNGIYVGDEAASGDPIFAANGWWSRGMSKGIYHSADRVLEPEPFAQDVKYLVGPQPKPSLTGTVYAWIDDWTAITGVYNGSTPDTDPRWTKAKSTYEINTTTRTETILDEITVDLSDGLYLGWHFSTTHAPTIIANGFEITDGVDTIRVTLVPQGSFNLVPTVRTSFNLGTYTLEKEWHETVEGGSLNRIHSNIGFTPDQITTDNEYNVIVAIQANPAPIGPVVNNPIRPFERFVL